MYTKVPVLLFHDVSPDLTGKPPGLTVSPKRFRALIEWLAAHGYTGISARDWLQAREGRGEIPPKPVVITFDDGYASIAEHAFPVLRDYAFGATVFVVTRLIGHTNAWDVPKWRSLPLMDANQLRFWAAAGVELGSHSCTHPDLTKLTACELEEEVASSRDELANVAGTPVVSFAYPYGLHNEAVRRVVSRTFSLAFSIEKGAMTPMTDPMRCERIEVMSSYSPLRVSLYLRFTSPVGLFGRLSRLARSIIFSGTRGTRTSRLRLEE